MSKTEEFPVLSVSVCKEFVTRLNKLKSKIPQIQLKEFSVKQLPLLSVKLVQYKAEEIEEDEEFWAPTSAPTCAELFPEYNVCQYCTNIAMKCWCPGSQSPIWEGESEGSQSPIWEDPYWSRTNAGWSELLDESEWAKEYKFLRQEYESVWEREREESQ